MRLCVKEKCEKWGRKGEEVRILNLLSWIFIGFILWALIGFASKNNELEKSKKDFGEQNTVKEQEDKNSKAIENTSNAEGGI